MKQIVAFLLAACVAAPAAAQQPEPPTRTSLIEQAQAEKAAALQPYQPGAAEKWLDYAENYLLTGRLTWHPFFQSPYSGGGFVLGAGYLKRVGSYNLLDMRGSFTFSGYKRIEAQFLAPAMFRRQATLSVLGGWREATQVGFFGLGSESLEGSSHQLRLQATVRIGVAGVPPVSQLCCSSRWLRGFGMATNARSRDGALRRDRLHIRNPPWPRRESDLSAFAGHGGP